MAIGTMLLLATMAASGQAAAPQDDPAQKGVTPAAVVAFEVRTNKSRHAISPRIYGVNSADFSKSPTKYLKFNRGGGNRLTAYNWETNASNAGTDYLNQNDDFLSSSSVPGAAFTGQIQKTLAAGADYVMTVPMAGYVAADEDGGGDVNQTPDFIDVRFNQSLPRKGAAFTTSPNLTDHKVFQDEFVNFIKVKFPAAFSGGTARISFMLDNEPDLWAYTHPRLRGSDDSNPGKPITYAELFARTKAYASAIKDVAPNALIYGPVNYGWEGYINLQAAPDARGRDFLDTFLRQMSAYDQAKHRRILDVLDVHWYPEALSSTGIRITEDNHTPEVVAARVQAPRSLYDPNYVEDSWISQDSVPGGVIELLPRLEEKIAKRYPGTKLSISEYNYGGGDHISGGVATADVLGIFGREGLYSANMWPLLSDESFTYAALAMYTDFDGAGAAFGDTSVKATTSDNVDTAIYASVDSADPDRVVLVMINRTSGNVPVSAKVISDVNYSKAHVWRLQGATAAPADKGLTPVASGSFSLTLPAYSVSTVLMVK